MSEARAIKACAFLVASRAATLVASTCCKDVDVMSSSDRHLQSTSIHYIFGVSLGSKVRVPVTVLCSCAQQKDNAVMCSAVQF